MLHLQNISVDIPLSKMDIDQMKTFMCKQDLTKIHYMWLGKEKWAGLRRITAARDITIRNKIKCRQERQIRMLYYKKLCP